MSDARPASGDADAGSFDARVTLEELRQRNLNAVAMDVLFLLTTAFFGYLFVQGFWPAAIAAVPLATLLYFGWRSSLAFLAAQVVVLAATVAASYAGLVPL